jgi:hypothetical protein
MAQRFYIGQTLSFRANFFDADGGPTSPESASLRLEYDRGTVETIPMAAVSAPTGEWRASWPTAGKPNVSVRWRITTTAAPTIAKFGTFTLHQT